MEHPDSYYRHHVFVCLNQRSNGEACCAQHPAQAAFDHMKKRIADLGLNGKGGVRINKAGCLDRCAGGPVMVVYPSSHWYTFVDLSDVDDIINQHLIGGQPVDRLLLDPSVGR